MSDVVDDLRGIAALDESRGETRLGIGPVCTRAVDEIKKLRMLREEDGRAMSALIEGYQAIQAVCIDGVAK